MSNDQRAVITIDGEWQGGTFPMNKDGKSAEAEAAAAVLRGKHPGKKVEVHRKSDALPSPAPTPQVPGAPVVNIGMGRPIATAEAQPQTPAAFPETPAQVLPVAATTHSSSLPPSLSPSGKAKKDY